MDTPVSNAALAARYDAIAYAAVPHAVTHPDRLATVATFLGHAAAAPARCRVLEVGCNDGSNLVPMAVSLPDASFVGCDLSPTAIASGQATIAALGLRNVTLLCQDLAGLAPALGPFDFIVAHGVYSWVPPHVRDALFALAQRTLAPNGVMFVSFNVLPGCRVRQAAWEMVHHHVDAIADPRARLAAARAIARLIADGGTSQHAADESVRAELRVLAEHTDSQIFHDDLALPNDPVYFRDFVAHAARHGLAYLAEAELHTMSGAGVSAGARQFLSTLDALGREQYLDFMRMRRFRQSLLRRADAQPAVALDPARIGAMHVSADASLVRAAQAGRIGDLARDLDQGGSDGAPVRSLLETLLRRAPGALPVAEARGLIEQGAGPARPIETLLRDAYVGGVVNLHVQPPALVTVAGERPLASPLARWQAARQDDLTSLLHARVRVPDANARRLLTLLDGTRNRTALVAATAAEWPAGVRQDADAFVTHALEQFARLALLAA